MDPLNIALIFYARPHLGGSGVMSTELAKQLAQRGHNVTIVSYPGTYLTEEEQGLGLQIRPVRNIDYPCFKAEPYSTTLASQVANMGKDGRVDVIHAHYAITHGEAALLARGILRRRKQDPKVVITSHGSDIHINGNHALMAPMLEYTLNEADGITFVSKNLRTSANAQLELSDPGEVIYNFVDEDRFSPSDDPQGRKNLRRQLEIPEDAVVVYHASNFREVKNTGLLLEAAREVYAKNPDVYFLMVGEGPEKEKVQRAAAELADNTHMRFVGRQNDVVPYISASDIGVLCSRYESFGLSILEPMACGLPVIGSQVGGIPEVINEKVGLLFPSNDVEGLARRILELGNSASARSTLGKAGRQRVLDQFSRPAIVNRYEDFYHSLMNNGR